MSILSPGAWLLLKICLIIIVVGLGILAVDRWIVRRGEVPVSEQRTQLASELSLEVIADADQLAQWQARLAGWSVLTGDVSEVEQVLRQRQAHADLWLVEFRSSERSILQTSVRPRHMAVQRLAIVLELQQAPGWPAFEQTDAAQAPPLLPAEYAQRLGRMSEYRMLIDGPWVAFISQPAGEPLLQIVQSDTSADFHPGLLNSALRIDVQRGLDIVAAMPGAPELERFYRLDGIEVQIDTPSVSQLSATLQAQREQTAAQVRAASEQAVADFQRQSAEIRRRQQENLARFRERNARNLERFRDPSATTDGSDAAAADAASSESAADGGDDPQSP